MQLALSMTVLRVCKSVHGTLGKRFHCGLHDVILCLLMPAKTSLVRVVPVSVIWSLLCVWRMNCFPAASFPAARLFLTPGLRRYGRWYFMVEDASHVTRTTQGIPDPP